MGWLEQLYGETVALDTAPFIYLMEENSLYSNIVQDFFERLNQGNFRAVTSMVSLWKSLSIPCALGMTNWSVIIKKYFAIPKTFPSSALRPISARDEATRNYLAERWQQLFTGTEIAPTALGIVPLRLVFSANHQAYDIELQDFAGALVRHEKNQDEVKKKLKEALFKSFQESSGIMFFLEAGEVDFQSQFERRLELDALLEVLHAQEKRELITRPIAIVITKWDKVVSGVVQSDQGKEVEAFLRKNYENLYALVQECSQNVKIFASSAFGFQTSAPDGRMDFKKIHPFNLEKPFAWIGQTIDELNYRRCELFEKENQIGRASCRERV